MSLCMLLTCFLWQVCLTRCLATCSKKCWDILVALCWTVFMASFLFRWNNSYFLSKMGSLSLKEPVNGRWDLCTYFERQRSHLTLETCQQHIKNLMEDEMLSLKASTWKTLWRSLILKMLATSVLRLLLMSDSPNMMRELLKLALSHCQSPWHNLFYWCFFSLPSKPQG